MASTSFHLTEEELQSSSAADGGETSNMMMDKIPILKRRAQQQQAAAASNESDNNNSNKSESNMKAKDPICVIVVGMAGSGKTTLMAQLQKSLNLKARNNASDAGDSSSDVSFYSVHMCIHVYYPAIDENACILTHCTHTPQHATSYRRKYQQQILQTIITELDMQLI